MKESNIFASNAATNQPQMYSISTGYFMKEFDYQATSQESLAEHMSQIPCRQYDNQASSNGNLARHKMACK